jgi:integrase
MLDNYSTSVPFLEQIQIRMRQRPKKLLDQVRDAIRLKHYAYSTEKTYVYWAKRFVLYHSKRHPLETGEKEISEFLTYLAVEENVAASTQNQALSALLFLYREVLRKDLDLPLELVWAERPKRVPTVLTREEVQQMIAQLTGVHRLIVQLLYGSGLRLTECMRLRVKDLDFGQRQVLVRDAKGGKDRVTILPNSLIKPLRVQLATAQQLHEQDQADGYGAVYLPYALDESIRMRTENGFGNTFSLLRNEHRTLVVPRFVAITSTRTLCKKPSRRLPKRPASPNGSRPTRSATPSLPTYWRITTTSALCRNSSATRT